MADKTKIQWTADGDSPGATWNPIIAVDKKTGKRGWFCTKPSSGCQRCYAEKINMRLGNGLPYIVGNLSRVDIKLNTDGKGQSALDWPLRAKRPRKIFVCSMTDLFGEFVPDEFIDKVFAVMALAHRHTFQVLTKRPKRMLAYCIAVGKSFARLKAACPVGWSLEYAGLPLVLWPLPNVHLGVSVEDQETADERIRYLLQTRAAVRWVSYEPALGPVDFISDGRNWLIDVCCRYGKGKEENGSDGCDGPGCMGTRISWCVVGGESGPGARPFNLQWARDIIAQCKAAGVPIFMKQLGARPYGLGCPIDCPCGVHHGFANRKGGDWSEWPEEFRVREYPRVR